MSRNEDYLDNLLTSVTDKLNEFDEDYEQRTEVLKESYQTQNELPSKTQSALDEVREDNFLREFENELQAAGGMEDDFMREFEQELNGAEDRQEAPPAAEDYVNEMDRIVNGPQDFSDDTLEVDTMSLDDPELESIFQDDVQAASGGSDAAEADSGTFDDLFLPEEKEQEDPMEAPEGMEGLEDIFGDIQTEENGDMPQTAAASQESGSFDMFEDLPQDDVSLTQMPEEPAQQQAEEVTEMLSDDELERLLSDPGSDSDDEALSEIGSLLDADQSGEIVEVPLDPEDPFSAAADFAFEESAIPEKPKNGRKKKKEKNPDSAGGKLSRLLFGAPEELDPETAAKIAEANAASGQKELTPKELKEKKKQEKELKKQQKKEAAEEKKKAKDAAKAEKAAKKAAKPKKEKKPKQKKKLPKETPLPKVPVAMMWGIALSLLVLVFLGTYLYGKASPASESKEAFESGDYVTAYAKLQGEKLSASQEEMYHASAALAGIQTELDAYTALMEQKQYELALDALIRGLGRCSVHAAEAEEWGVSDQLSQMEKQLVKLLKGQFNVSSRKAKKLYKIKKRSEYTMQLHEILDGLGLETKG